jgi:cation diffusion facilitator family transporter
MPRPPTVEAGRLAASLLDLASNPSTRPAPFRYSIADCACSHAGAPGVYLTRTPARVSDSAAANASDRWGALADCCPLVALQRPAGPTVGRVATEGSTVAVLTALFGNLGIAVTKFVAFLLTQSSSMLAESLHSLADTGNQVLLLIGGKRAEREPTREHPFGYGRARYVYGFLVAVVLFSLGGLFALYEAWHKWAAPEPITSWRWVPIVVLLVAMALEGYSLRTAVRESDKIREDRSWPQFVRTTKSPELAVVLLEDVGALLGLVFAFIGVSLTLATGDGRWDAVGSAVIGLLLVAIAGVLATEMTSLLVGESVGPANRQAIEAAIPGGHIESVIHMRTLHLGPEQVLVAAKVAVRAGVTAEEIATAIDDAERRIRQAVPIAQVIYLEPDLRRAGAVVEESSAVDDTPTR